MNNDPVLDRGRLDAIADGSDELAQSLLTMLVGEATRIIAEIRAATAEADGVRVLDLLHSLKGIAGNVGAVRLQRAAEALEGAERRDVRMWQIGVARLDRELEALSALR